MLTAINLKEDRAGSKMVLENNVDEQGLLSLCKDFLAIDSQQGVWRFTHLSVQGYLEKRERLAQAEAHRDFAAMLLSLLMRADPVDDDVDWSEEEAVNPSDILHARHPLQKYATLNWGHHTHAAQQSDCTTLVPILKEFLGSPDKASTAYARWDEKHEFTVKPDSFLQFYAWVPESELKGKSPTPIIAMCFFSLDSILFDWWESAAIDLTVKNWNFHSLLIIAAFVGSASMCRLLIRKGMDVNWSMCGRKFGNALMAAAHKADVKILALLLRHGADPNVPPALPAMHPSGQREDAWGIGNALTVAIESGDLGTVDCLISANADVNFYFDHDICGETCFQYPLEYAAVRQDTKILQRLLQVGANPDGPANAEEKLGPLDSAIAYSRLECVRVLLEDRKNRGNAEGLSHFVSQGLAMAERRQEPLIKQYMLENVPA